MVCAAGFSFREERKQVMKIKSLLVSAIAIASLFGFIDSKTAKADTPLGYSYDAIMSDGEDLIPDDGPKLTCQLYCQNGQKCGTITLDFSSSDKVTVSVQTPHGGFTAEQHADDGFSLPSADGNLLVSVGDVDHITNATGDFRGVTGLIHRCLFALGDNGLPTRCINCLYAFLRD